MADHIAAQIQDGQFQQLFRYQIENIDDAPGTSVAVIKGVNALKLVVDDGHFDQGVEVTQGVIIDEANQLIHIPAALSTAFVSTSVCKGSAGIG